LDWQKIYAAVYRASKDTLKPVVEIDELSLNDLVGIEEQKKALVQNTLNFIQNKTANHALLWGAKGCGKSSLIRAVFCEFKTQNLRLVQITQQDLYALVDIIDELRLEPYKFIIFCDDFSFEHGDQSYRFLKPLMEGGIEKCPQNILIYASSNRRHFISETNEDNYHIKPLRTELHLSEAADEKLSLSDRFGLWLSFYEGSFKDYLEIVDFYFKDFLINKDELHQKAKEFAMLRASKSARTAKQFYLSFKDLL